MRMTNGLITLSISRVVRKVFLDTNVLLDFFLCREGVDHARSILLMGYGETCELYVSSLAFSHLAYIMRKVAKGNALYDILDTLMEMVRVVSVDRNVIADSVALRANDFEDAIQYYSAKKIGADYIVTNNIKDFGFSDIDVVKPIDFLRFH